MLKNANDDADTWVWCITAQCNDWDTRTADPDQIAGFYASESFYAEIVSYLRHLTEDSLAKFTKPTRDNNKRYAFDGPLMTIYALDA